MRGRILFPECFGRYMYVYMYICVGSKATELKMYWDVFFFCFFFTPASN